VTGCMSSAVAWGHRDVQTTQNLYAWVTEDAELRAVADWGDYREEICQQLWEQIPEPLRLERFDAASTGGHPRSGSARRPRRPCGAGVSGQE
jgi:hypothetical protein